MNLKEELTNKERLRNLEIMKLMAIIATTRKIAPLQIQALLKRVLLGERIEIRDYGKRALHRYRETLIAFVMEECEKGERA